MHKRPEDEMWLPTEGQIGNGRILVSFLAPGERFKQANYQIAYLIIILSHFQESDTKILVVLLLRQKKNLFLVK